MARLTLDIPDDTHRKLKMLAAYFGMSMKDFLISRALPSAESRTSDSHDAERLDNLLFSPESSFQLSPENWNSLNAALEAPPVRNMALTRLMTTRGVLDEP